MFLEIATPFGVLFCYPLPYLVTFVAMKFETSTAFISLKLPSQVWFYCFLLERFIATGFF